MDLLVLPTELLGEIFNYLLQPQLASIGATSKILNEVLWSHVKEIYAENIDKIPLRHMRGVESLTIENPHPSSQNLTTLTTLKRLSLIVDVSSKEDRIMMNRMTYLQELEFRARGASEFDLAPFLANNSRLTWLLYSPLEASRVKGLGVLTRLKHLSIQYAAGVTDEDLLPIMELTSLTGLELTWLSNMTGKTLQELTRLSNLIHLELISNMLLKDEDYTVLQHLTKLMYLDLSFEAFPTKSKAIQSIATLTQLTALLVADHFSTGMYMNDTQALTSLTNLKYLNFIVKHPEQLNLAAFHNLQEVVINHSAKIIELVNITTLRTLRVEYSPFDEKAITEGLCKMTQLTVLDLNGVESFEIDTFAQHCSNLKNLLQLRFLLARRRGPPINLNQFCEALQPITSLNSLTLEDLPSASVIKKLTQLSMLHLTGKTIMLPHGLESETRD